MMQGPAGSLARGRVGGAAKPPLCVKQSRSPVQRRASVLRCRETPRSQPRTPSNCCRGMYPIPPNAQERPTSVARRVGAATELQPNSRPRDVTRWTGWHDGSVDALLRDIGRTERHQTRRKLRDYGSEGWGFEFSRACQRSSLAKYARPSHLRGSCRLSGLSVVWRGNCRSFSGSVGCGRS